MNVAVYDTYVQRPDGRRMHFDILVHDTEKDLSKILAHGQRYLTAKGIDGRLLSAQRCNFCHTEPAHPSVVQEIAKEGFAIIELQDCD